MIKTFKDLEVEAQELGLSLREVEWRGYAREVLAHVADYTVKQYGDYPKDKTSEWTARRCIEEMQKYCERFGQGARGQQEQERDLLKIGHYACMALSKLRGVLPVVKRSKPGAIETILDYINQHIGWSAEAFGPGEKHIGLIRHIEKELREIEEDPKDIKEWVDVIILAIDGAWRQGHSAEAIWEALKAKQAVNIGREWPQGVPDDEPIEHIG